jgi:hypothetical protein
MKYLKLFYNPLKMKTRINLLIVSIIISIAGYSQVRIKGNEDTITLSKFKFDHPMTFTSSK